MIRPYRMLAALLAGLLLACAPSDEDLDSTRGGRVDVFFNDPGSRMQNMWEPDAIDVMIEGIRDARGTIDMAVMGFSYQPLIDVLIQAYDRGVTIRMVGDAGHLYNAGYEAFRERRIPLVAGNLQHIMHDKFMVIDDRFVYASTSNWTPTDLRHNINNFLVIDSPHVAADFTAEFEQMWAGRFGHNKVEIDNGRSYQVGDTTVEVWFSPHEDVVGRMIELVDAAQESVRFTIFAFTKDQVGSAFIRKQQELAGRPTPDGLSPVAGVIDQSQLHSNGQYHEVFRLLGAGLDLRMDANDNSYQPGDYQAGGGRLHSKTMVIDADGDNPIVLTGSFNWSASATQSNDEYLIVMHGGRIAKAYAEEFGRLWGQGRPMGSTRVADGSVAPGDVVIQEVMWYGGLTDDPRDEGNDEFVELLNRTDRTLELDLWQLANDNDFVVGFPPGSTVGPGETFLILDHTLEIYDDGVPQDEQSAFQGGDLVVNAFNDNRQARLYLKDANLKLRLLDPDGEELDVAGDGGPAFAGGPHTALDATAAPDTNPCGWPIGTLVARSMERRPIEAGGEDGTAPASWYAPALSTCTGGLNVREPFRSTVLATPGEANSPAP